MPHLTSNIASKMFYFLFGAEILRTTPTTSKCETFFKTSEDLIFRMSKQKLYQQFYMDID